MLGEVEPLAEDCLVPTPAPESTEKVRFVFICFCLPSGIPSASEGGASHLLFSPVWGTCHLACLLFLSTYTIGTGSWDETGLLSFPGGCLHCLDPQCVLTQLLYFPNIPVRRSWRTEEESVPAHSPPGAPAPQAQCTTSCRYNSCVSGQKPLTKVLLMHKQKAGVTLFSPGLH